MGGGGKVIAPGMGYTDFAAEGKTPPAALRVLPYTCKKDSLSKVFEVKNTRH